MAIKIKCSACGKTVRPPDSAAGKNIRCPECRFVLKVPGGAAADSGITRPAAEAAVDVQRKTPRTRLWLLLGVAVIGALLVVLLFRLLR